MYFRKLNSYSKAWRSDFASTVATVKRILATWAMYSTIDLSKLYFHISIDEELQHLFCFELNGRIFAYQTLPQGWASSAYLFHSKFSTLWQACLV